MKRLVVVSALLLSAVLVSAQERREYWHVTVPGKLESVLLSNNAPLLRHELGSLTSLGTVKMFAVVTSDPSSKALVKGLEVQLEGDDLWNNNRHCKDTVFIDDDGLKDLERRLANAVQDEKWIEVNRLENGYLPNEHPSIILAANRGPREGTFSVPVSFGYYWHDDRFGVYVMAPHSLPTSGPHNTTQFYMPDADISEVLAFVRDGRLWLERNPPKSLASSSVARSGQ